MSWARRSRLHGFQRVPFEDRPGPLVNFAYRTERSVKVECSVCGSNGYGPARQDARLDDDLDKINGYAPWQLRCLMGHGRCPKCGRWGRVKLDGTARAHARCKGEVR